ncbi:MAG: hypothetical protein VCE91_01165 [Nitrospinota bacterium]
MMPVGLEVVETASHVGGDAADDRAVVGIGAVVHGHLHLAGEDNPVLVGGDPGGVKLVGPEGAEDKLFLAVVVELDGPARFFGGDDGEEVDIELAGRLPAEAAADVVGNHPDFGFGNLEDFGEILVAQARALGRIIDGQVAAGRPFGNGDVGLKRAMGLTRGGGGRFADVVRLVEGLVHLAEFHVLGEGDVVGPVLVDDRRAFLHGLEDVEHRGEVFVFHLDQLQRLFGDVLVGRHDGRHGLADEADLPPRQGDLIVAEGNDPPPHVLGDVLSRENEQDARKRLGPACVDVLDQRMGVFAGLELSGEHPGKQEVHRVEGASGHFFRRVHARYAFPDIGKV